MRFLKFTSIGALTLLLGACGGGGSDSPAVNPVTATFSLSASAISFTAYDGGVVPASQTINATMLRSVFAFGAAYVSAPQPTWLNVSITGTAPNFTVSFSVNTTSLAVGQRTAVVTLGATDASGNVLQSQNIQVSYTLNEGMRLVGTPTSTSFVFGDVRTTQSLAVNVTANSKNWTITSSVPWLVVPATVQQGSIALALTADAGALVPGNYTASLVATNVADPQDKATLNIPIQVMAPTLTVGASPLVLGGVDGLEALSTSLGLSLNTGANSYPWTVTTTDVGSIGWLLAGVTNGFANSLPTPLQLSVDRSRVAPGTYTGTATFDVTVRGYVFRTTLPVTANIESHRLFVSADGVSLSSFPSRSVLSRTLTVASSRGRSVQWSATSNVSWLTVTPSGSSGDSLVITANPTALAADQLHKGVVTLTSTNPDIERSEIVRVGLWVGAVDPSDVSVPIDGSPSFFPLVANPAAPYVYRHNKGTSISMYNVYTGALEQEFTNVADQAGPLAVSSDGAHLFVVDGATHNINKLDAYTGAVIATYPSSLNFSGTFNLLTLLDFSRPNGRKLLWAPWDEVWDVESDTKLTKHFLGSIEGEGIVRAFSANQQTLYTTMSSSPSKSQKFSLNYSALGGRSLTVQQIVATPQDLWRYGGSLCVAADGLTGFVLYGNIIVAFDPDTLLETHRIITTDSAVQWYNMVCARDNRLYLASSEGSTNTGSIDEVRILDNSGVELTSLTLHPPSTVTRGGTIIELSSDSTRIIGIQESVSPFGWFLRIRANPF